MTSTLSCTGRTMSKSDDDGFAEWLEETRRDDPVGYETRVGEGWTAEEFRAEYARLYL